eukprot:CAMPEP_0202345886 /NCGR_PEP_ID=MMETSP1126-20121109/4923_1 /ASSEMBLY_ACC=CAM_ASM_000457 /TAXON_ID=3047 /ORGANISM="Dunaliella tertiolecta, Strain CCMP1320" /LENGTH=529 /DNA_ID=CAMNT_0048937235 /DNA_START=217 /DNA_END=1806 /DNA_ORIENTATION=+
MPSTAPTNLSILPPVKSSKFPRSWFSFLSVLYCHILLLVSSLPRAGRTLVWVMQAAISYTWFQWRHRHENQASAAYQDALSEQHNQCAIKLLRVCRANGGVYIKAGQFASAFGAVPIEYRRKMACLEDRAIPKPYSVIRNVMLEELGPEAETIFSRFDRNATAAASLAQVHRACLVTGEEVAVKVQYPALAGAVAADLAAIKLFSWLVSKFFPKFNMDWLAYELEHKLATELNFLNEIHNARKLSAILQGRQYKECSAPYMYEELSSPRLIIMEWVNGVKINDIQALKAAGIEPKAVGWALVKVFAELMLIQGYIHGDPHPGNAMVRRRGRRGFWHWLLRDKRQPFEIVMLDHGTYFTADTVMRQQLCQLWCSFVLGDKQLQADVGNFLAGERGASILPVLLTHAARTREEERRLQQSLGIEGFSDMSELLQTASRDLVELLRINTVIRAVSNQLGVSMDERKRVFAWFARRGLPPYYVHAPHIHHKFNQVRRRLQLCTYVLGWHTVVTARACLVATWRYMLGLMYDVL